MILRPSESPRWMKCAASAHFKAPRPEVETEAAMQGTAAAWLAEQCHKLQLPPEAFLGNMHENGVTIDADMVTHVTSYLKHIQGGATEVFLQHPTLPCQGTADHQGWADTTVFEITDLKYGYDVVEPESYQLTAYMMLALRNMPPATQVTQINLRIYQPRAMHHEGPLRSRTLTIDEAWAEVVEMERRIVEVLTPEHQRQALPGRHCMHCTKAFACEALTHSVYHLFDVVERRNQLEPTPYQLSGELDMLETCEVLLKARSTAVRTEAIAQMNEGTYIPGWSLDHKFGNRAFTVDPEFVGAVTGTDPYQQKVVTPAELERRGADKEVVKTITTKPRIGTTLARTKSEKKVAELFAAAQAGGKA